MDGSEMVMISGVVSGLGLGLGFEVGLGRGFVERLGWVSSPLDKVPSMFFFIFFFLLAPPEIPSLLSSSTPPGPSTPTPPSTSTFRFSPLFFFFFPPDSPVTNATPNGISLEEDGFDVEVEARGVAKISSMSSAVVGLVVAWDGWGLGLEVFLAMVGCGRGGQMGDEGDELDWEVTCRVVGLDGVTRSPTKMISSSLTEYIY